MTDQWEDWVLYAVAVSGACVLTWLFVSSVADIAMRWAM